MANDDLYAVLGLYYGASYGEIRSAYRRLAMIWHPDKYVGMEPEKAKLKFQEIHNAYKVLSDWKRRRCYDARYRKSQLWRQACQGGCYDARYRERQARQQKSPVYEMRDFLGELMNMMQQEVDHGEGNVSSQDLVVMFSNMFGSSLCPEK